MRCQRRRQQRRRRATGSKQTTTAGVNKTKVSTANTAADTDSVWVERIDIDGDGDVEDSNLVWDDEDKVLFAYSTGTFACQNGGTATADLLVAAYGTGNSSNKPVGSGFWVADLDKGDCGAQAAAMWGCKFDANGNSTACGIATTRREERRHHDRHRIEMIRGTERFPTSCSRVVSAPVIPWPGRAT